MVAPQPADERGVRANRHQQHDGYDRCSKHRILGLRNRKSRATQVITPAHEIAGI
jgi:hypothetical protein